MIDMDTLCINTIRTLAMDAVQTAKSGHPGAPMGLAPVGYYLYRHVLRFDPDEPHWPTRDRFVLSCGHASMLLYALLHLFGYDLSLEELKRFRQWGSQTPGHPEYGHAPGVEVTTGPLGQGFGAAVGMAIAQAWLAAKFSRPGFADLFDYHVYVLCSDGDLMEGVSSEAASLAGHLGLGKLVAIYDDNRITIEGSTDLAFSEDVDARFAAYGWHVQTVDDVNDLVALAAAVTRAREETARPSLIRVRSHIAYGSPNKQDTAEAHGAPLGDEEVALTKERLGWPTLEPFFVPEEARKETLRAAEAGRRAHQEWKERFLRYAQEYPSDAEMFEEWMGEKLPERWDHALPAFLPEEGPMATRVASGKVINALAQALPNLVGGSADLAPSTNTLIKGEMDFGRDCRTGRNLRFGIREHAMGAALHGMALSGGVIPFGATFLVFSDYMRPPIRLAAMSGKRLILVFTHDSIALGEDGPTHQPVEHLAALRAIPNVTVIRPADANEVAEAWRLAILTQDRPVALILSRQNLPILDRTTLAPAAGVRRGGYVLADLGGDTARVILLASGSEVHIALEAGEMLASRGVACRVVNLASWELFEAQDARYRDDVLPASVQARVAVEAGSPLGWERYVGPAGTVIAMHRFGASAPAAELARQFGFTPEAIVEAAKRLL